MSSNMLTDGPTAAAAPAHPHHAAGQDETVGVRELRQHITRILAEVERGARVTITRNGRPVATLRSVQTPGDPLESLVATGAANHAESPDDLLDVVPAAAAGGEPASAMLVRVRDEERW